MKSILLIISVLLLFTQCSTHKGGDQKNAVSKFCIPDSLMSQIKLDTASFKPVYDELRLIGKITFDQEKVVRIYPLVSGNVSEVKLPDPIQDCFDLASQKGEWRPQFVRNVSDPLASGPLVILQSQSQGIEVGGQASQFVIGNGRYPD